MTGAVDRAELRARLDEAEGLWLWRQTDELRAGYGAHMGQMLYRLPRDGQTDDMRASIETMLRDQRSLLDQLDAAEAAIERVRALRDQFAKHENWRVWGIPQAITAALDGPAEEVAG